MQALKGLVVGMGILIVAGMALLVWGFYHKATDPGFSLFSGWVGNVVSDAAAPKAFGEVSISLPEGCTVVEVRPDGNRVYLRVGPPVGACARVVVIDTGTGSVLGTIRVRP